MRRDTGRLAILAFVAVLLQACGGSGDPAPAAPPSTPAPVPETANDTLLPFVTAAGELKLFDPQSPGTASATVDDNLDLPFSFSGSAPAGRTPFAGVTPVLAGTYQAATNSIADAHTRYLAYLRQGQVRRVDLLRTQSHAPVTVSSITDGCFISSGAFDYAEPLDSGVLVAVGGADHDCATSADNESRWVRLDSTPTDAGVAGADGLVAIESTLAADGSLANLIVFDELASKLVRYDANLANPVDIVALAAGTFPGGGPDASRTTLYFVVRPSGETANRIMRYDAAANTVTYVHTYAGSTSLAGRGASDTTHLYFAEGGVVRRVAHTGSTAEALHTAASGFVTYPELGLTNGRIVLRAADSGSATPNSIGSLAKTGGTTLTDVQAATAEPLRLVGIAGQRVYWIMGTVGGGTQEAANALEDGTSVNRYAQGSWVAEVDNTAFNIGAVDVHSIPRLFVLSQRDGTGLAALRPVVATTGAVGDVLGMIMDAVWGRSIGYGRYLPLNMQIARGAPNDFDVYFADTATAGSLQPLAETAGADDVAP
jgi:hypothetical protein